MEEVNLPGGTVCFLDESGDLLRVHYRDGTSRTCEWLSVGPRLPQATTGGRGGSLRPAAERLGDVSNTTVNLVRRDGSLGATGTTS